MLCCPPARHASVPISVVCSFNTQEPAMATSYSIVSSSTSIDEQVGAVATGDSLSPVSVTVQDEGTTETSGTIAIAFVDRGIANLEAVVAALDPSVEVVILDQGRDGIEQIADALADRQGIGAI